MDQSPRQHESHLVTGPTRSRSTQPGTTRLRKSPSPSGEVHDVLRLLELRQATRTAEASDS